MEFDPSVNSCEALMQKFFAEAGAGGGTRCREYHYQSRERESAVLRARLSAPVRPRNDMRIGWRLPR